jgi:hypothetical protein
MLSDAVVARKNAVREYDPLSIQLLDHRCLCRGVSQRCDNVTTVRGHWSNSCTPKTREGEVGNVGIEAGDVGEVG